MTRAERKARQRAEFAQRDAIAAAIAHTQQIELTRQAAARLEWERLHPVSSGRIPLVDYVPPKWSYRPATGNPLFAKPR